MWTNPGSCNVAVPKLISHNANPADPGSIETTITFPELFHTSSYSTSRPDHSSETRAAQEVVAAVMR